jgi:hypothetical protein
MSRFDQQAERSNLRADSGVLNEWLPEGLAFARVIVGVLSADTSEAKGSGGKAKTLRVEIRHYEGKSAVEGPNDVIERDVNVFKGDKCGACDKLR